LKRHIVVIEDEIGLQTMLRDIFESEGDTVLGITHGGIAREILRDTRADLILIDLVLPDMPGTHLAAELRENGHAHTPMVALSADHVNVLFAQRSGLFQEAMRKPFDVDELLAVADAYAGRYVTQPAS
jgi:DNA-binding response OmpR family regulator